MTWREIEKICFQVPPFGEFISVVLMGLVAFAISPLANQSRIEMDLSGTFAFVIV